MAAEDWLTVSNVEDLHHALQLKTDAGRIAAAIARIKHVTLPALVEYGCLRWSLPELPPLPQAIHESPLGRSMQLVASPFGIRTSGAATRSPTDLSPRPCEFMVINSTEEAGSDDAEFFKTRFWNSAQGVGFSKNVSALLGAGLHEMMTNAVQHANSPVSVLAGYAVLPKFAQFTVADVGQGVLAALRQSHKYKHVSRHSDAIRLAIHEGVTSDPNGKGGFGFCDIFKALAEQWGYLRFRSGEACLLADGTGLNADTGELRPVPSLSGFQVSVSCRAAALIPNHPTV